MRMINKIMAGLGIIILFALVVYCEPPPATLHTPADNSILQDITPPFTFNITGENNTYSCELFIDGTGYSENTSTTNNTITTLTANVSIFYGNHTWYINCTNGSVMNQSATRNFNISLSATANITVVNTTGNLSNMTVCYTTTATGNLTFMMEDLGGDCNYGIFDVTNQNNSLTDIRNPYSLTDITECNLTVTANSTAGTYCITIREQEELSESNLPGIIAAAAITVTTIIYALRWDSKT